MTKKKYDCARCFSSAIEYTKPRQIYSEHLNKGGNSNGENKRTGNTPK